MTVIDETVKIETELSNLQSELDRILYLLKIADPLGDAARRREAKAKEPKPKQLVIDMRKQPQAKQKKPVKDEKLILTSPLKETTNSAEVEMSPNPEEVNNACEKIEKKAPLYTVAKPQWLGDVNDKKLEEDYAQEVVAGVTEPDSFIDYKDRKKALASANDEPELEHAAPGLIIRKRKPADKPDQTVDKARRVEDSPSSNAEATVIDAVTLLLKHKRGYSALDDEIRNESHEFSIGGGKEISQPRRVLGPSKPDFLEKSPDYEAWVPPEGINASSFFDFFFFGGSDSFGVEFAGQTGDGRTSLNDRLGY